MKLLRNADGFQYIERDEQREPIEEVQSSLLDVQNGVLTTIERSASAIAKESLDTPRESTKFYQKECYALDVDCWLQNNTFASALVQVRLFADGLAEHWISQSIVVGYGDIRVTRTFVKAYESIEELGDALLIPDSQIKQVIYDSKEYFNA
jgi:hypothetical protein